MQQQAFARLKAQRRAEVVEATGLRYEEARGVYCATISPKPPLIARCADAADVIAAVQFARHQKFRALIQCGGHGDGGFGFRDDGLAMDHPLTKYAHVAPAARAFQAGGGRTVGGADHATQALQLAVPSGINSTTGVYGWTLEGGNGYLTRNSGLAIDNLLAADAVLVNGSFVSQLERRTR